VSRRYPSNPWVRSISFRRITTSMVRTAFKLTIGAEISCACCGWRPRPPLTLNAINAHHIVPKTSGGEDTPENLISLCPNCHAMAHAIWGRSAAPSRTALVEGIQQANGGAPAPTS
jgi:5-methylcytosine-specific restriction endonuclease McrA